MERIIHEITLPEGTLRLETGEFAKQAGGAVLVSYQGVTLLVTATASAEPREGIDFFPLLVDFEERMYAAGKFPGGFFKREGRPSEEAILNARKIDRTIRPLFPSYFRNDVQVVATALSVDQKHPPDVPAIVGASAALALSPIPFPRLVAAVRVGYMHGDFILNPTYGQIADGDMDLLVAGTDRYINMIEDQSREIDESILFEGMKCADEEIKRLIGEIEVFVQKAGAKPKMEIPAPAEDEALRERVREKLTPLLGKIIPYEEKTGFYAALDDAKRTVRASVVEETPEVDALLLDGYLDKVVKEYAREYTLREGRRVDGRASEDIRPIAGRVGFLPRVHGSGAFTRGQTQVISSVTLGTFADRQRIDTANIESEKRYVHHYNFPPYSVGEVRPIRGPGRREIGHGALAEKALVPLVPSEEDFPYSIRVVSEITESNASSSMASVCGSSLALMDAGVPIPRAVAGISIGLLHQDDDHYLLLSDLTGFEDFNGDMDFKVAGTEQGVTAIQMDTKIEGLTLKLIKETLERARHGRLYVLEQMKSIISRPRPEISEHAPTLLTLKIDVDQIGLVIGPAGRNVKKIQTTTGAEVDVDEEGTVYISGVDRRGVYKAYETIKAMTQEIEKDMVFEGTVVSIVPFGAFIELVPGRDGLLHISNVADHRIDKVEDYLKVGDKLTVRVRDVDENGKVNLIREDIEYTHPTGPRRGGGGGDRSPRGGRGGGGSRPRRSGDGRRSESRDQRGPRRSDRR